MSTSNKKHVIVTEFRPERADMLVVEDEAVVALDLVSRLKQMGYRHVDYVLTAKDAIESLTRLKPGFVLLDINFGRGGSGIDVGMEIRRKHHIPFVYLTTNSDAATFERARTTDPVGFIQKPVSDSQLRSTIEVALDRHTTIMKKEGRIDKLSDALRDLNKMLLNLEVCAWCKRIKDDDDHWTDISTFLMKHLDFSPSHGMCPECCHKETGLFSEATEDKGGECVSRVGVG